MQAHVHISPVHIIASLLAFVAVAGTVHLLTLTTDNRLTRAAVALNL